MRPNVDHHPCRPRQDPVALTDDKVSYVALLLLLLHPSDTRTRVPVVGRSSRDATDRSTCTLVRVQSHRIAHCLSL